jgi:hypothetical protein
MLLVASASTSAGRRGIAQHDVSGRDSLATFKDLNFQRFKAGTNYGRTYFAEERLCVSNISSAGGVADATLLF